MIDLKGHSALITGSTKGVGRSIAEAFASAGANVVLHGRKRDAGAEEVLANCQGRGVRAEFVTADLMAETIPTVDRLFADTLASMPDIDILVNNAGTYIDQPFLEMDWATYDRTMRLNVAAPYFLTQRFARHWVANKVAGRILMIGSINGRLAEPTHSCYDASKGAIDAMVRSLCVSLAPYGIRVNGLAPGWIRTTWAESASQYWQTRATRQSLRGRWGTPQDVARVAAFLASPEADFVSGQIVPINGGFRYE